MEQIQDEDLRVYVVWVPILWSDGKATIPQATKWVPDSRGTHYWDGNSVLVNGYARIFKNDGPAWDAFLVFDRDVEWKDDPPAPTYLMDQIGLEVGRPLDAPVLATEIRNLLSNSKVEKD